MRRILLLVTDLQIGGTPTVIRELALRLSAAGGAHVDVACLSPWGPVADQISAAGIGVTAFNAGSDLQFPLVVWRLARLIRTLRVDTVFSFLVHANMVAAAAAPLCQGVRWIQSIQTTQPRPRWHWSAQSVAQQAAERIAVPSPSVAAVARDWASVPVEKIVVIPNAVETHLSRRLPQDHPTRVGFIGRLDPIKRIPDLLQAVALLAPPVALHVFGEGAERTHIEAEIARLGLTARVTLHGAVARPHEAFAQMDVLVLPSEAEGFGLVLIEAMAAGVPVVATNVAGIRDVVRNGQTGLLVPVASPALLAGAIRRMLDDSALREGLVLAAREDVAARFSWERVLPMYRALLGIAG